MVSGSVSSASCWMSAKTASPQENPQVGGPGPTRAAGSLRLRSGRLGFGGSTPATGLLCRLSPGPPTQDPVPGTTPDEAPALRVAFLWWKEPEKLCTRGAGWGGRWGPQRTGPSLMGVAGRPAPQHRGPRNQRLCVGGVPAASAAPSDAALRLEPAPASLSPWVRRPAPRSGRPSHRDTW